MTLKHRNYILIASILISTAAVIFISALFLIAAAKNQITPPLKAVRPFSFTGNFLFKQNFTSVIISIFIFSIYVPLILFIIFRLFEKTQAMEIIFFCLFLFGCFMEQVRIFMPMFGLWQTYTALLNTIGRIVITGRMLSPLAFFFITVFSTTEHRQEFTQNIIMALLISVFTGLLMPLDASNTTSTCTVVWSYRGFFLAVRIFMFIATTVCFIYNAKQHGWRDVKQSLTGYLFLISGYALLCNADCMALLSSGALFLAIGTWQFIASYHKQYLWR